MELERDSPSARMTGRRTIADRLAAVCATALLWLGAAPAGAPAAGGFGVPVDVSAPGGSAYGATVATAADGGTLAAWLRSDGANVRVQIAERTADGAFAEPVDLSPPGLDASGPTVALSATGDAVVTWCQPEGSRARLYAALRPAGGEFADPQLLSSPDAAVWDCERPVWGLPHAAFGPSGEGLAVWTESRPGAPDVPERVHAAELPAGGDTFGSPRPVSPAAWSARNPQVSFDGTGAATLAWRAAQAGLYFRIQSVTRPPGGPFGAVQELSNPASHGELARVATGPDGTTAVAWRRVRLYGAAAEVAVRPPGGAFGPRELSRPIDVPDYADALHLAGPPAAAVGPDGTVIAVWRDTVGGDRVTGFKRAFAAVRPPGGVFGAPVPLSAPGRNAGAPRIVIDGDGDAIAVWRRRSDASLKYRIQAALRPAGGEFGPAQTLSSDGRNAFAPRVAVDAHGRATILWRRSDGAHWRIQSARCTP